MADGGLPFPDTGCPVPDVYIYYVYELINVWILFRRLSTSLGRFRLWTLFLDNGLDNTEWASFISDLHTKQRITIGIFFWYSGENFIDDILIYVLSQCVFTLPSFCLLFFLSLYFSSEITSFYTKYFVLPYSIDVVLTVSYHIFLMYL